MKGSRGFSFIEVIVSIFIVGVMLVLLQAVIRSNTLISIAKNQGIALSIVRSEIESLRSGGYAAVPASGSFSHVLLDTLPPYATATLLTSDFNAKTKQVVVSVEWRNNEAAASSTLSLSTLITETGGLP